MSLGRGVGGTQGPLKQQFRTSSGWAPKFAWPKAPSGEGLHRLTINEGLRLALMAPDIVQAAFDGTLPRTVSLEALQRATIPLEWGKQRGLIEELGRSIRRYSVHIIPLNTVILMISPDSKCGRVEAFRSTLTLAGDGPPLGYTLTGAVADVRSPAMALVAGSMACAFLVGRIATTRRESRGPKLGSEAARERAGASGG